MYRYRFCGVCKNVEKYNNSSNPCTVQTIGVGVAVIIEALKAKLNVQRTAFSFCRFADSFYLNIAVAGTVHKFSTAGCKCQEVCKLFSWLFCAFIYGGECGTQKNILVRRFYFGCNLLLKGREENSTRLREKFTMRFGLLMGFTAI